MVGHHVAISAITIIAVRSHNALTSAAPVTISGVPLAEISVEPGDDRVPGDEPCCHIEELTQVVLDEGQGLHGGQGLSAVDRLTIMADTRCASRQIDRPFRITGSDHGPTVDEDLRSNLFSDNLAILGDRSARGGSDPIAQVEVGRMLGRVPHPSPPENRAQRQDVVQPGLTDLGWLDQCWIVIILEGAQKGKGAREVVVGHDESMVAQWDIVALMDVVANFTQLGQNLLVAPPLKGAAQVDTNHLAQHTGVDALGVVVWQ